MVRRIAVFVSNRADYWPLSPVLEQLAGDDRAELRVLATAAHRGGPLEEALAPDLVEILDVALGHDDPQALLEASAHLSVAVGVALGRWRPDLLVVLGDRYELLGVAAAATLHRVPLVHLHGGEVTEGAIDDAVRHAMTKLSHLHLCATEGYARRVRSLGEEPWRVHAPGEPTVDRLLRDAARHPVEELARCVGRELARPLGLLTYHPPTLGPERAAPELEALLAAAAVLSTVIVTHPGPDPGAAAIRRRLERWAGERDGVAVVASLGALYPRALAEADVVLGNSSSGIVEAATFRVPVVNVGDRQRGRERWPGVIDVPGTPEAVREAVAQALAPGFRESLRDSVNPYGDGKAAPRIVDLLVSVPLEPLLKKRFVDAPEKPVSRPAR